MIGLGLGLTTPPKTVPAAPAKGRLTEAGEYRVTEAGDRRVQE